MRFKTFAVALLVRVVCLSVLSIVLFFCMAAATALYENLTRAPGIPMGDMAVIWGVYPDGTPIVPQNCEVEVTKVGRSTYRMQVRDRSQDGFELEMRINTGFVRYDWEHFEKKRLILSPRRSKDGLRFEPDFDMKKEAPKDKTT